MLMLLQAAATAAIALSCFLMRVAVSLILLRAPSRTIFRWFGLWLVSETRRYRLSCCSTPSCGWSRSVGTLLRLGILRPGWAAPDAIRLLTTMIVRRLRCVGLSLLPASRLMRPEQLVVPGDSVSCSWNSVSQRREILTESSVGELFSQWQLDTRS